MAKALVSEMRVPFGSLRMTVMVGELFLRLHGGGAVARGSCAVTICSYSWRVVALDGDVAQQRAHAISSTVISTVVVPQRPVQRGREI